MASVKPIRSDEDYKKTMDRIRELWNADTDEEGEELEVLAVLADDWENRTFKAPRLSRGDKLEQILDARGLRPAHLAETVGSLGRVYDLLKGTRSITDKMAVRLAEFFQIDPNQFLKIPASLQTGEDKPRRNARHLLVSGANKAVKVNEGASKGRPRKSPAAEFVGTPGSKSPAASRTSRLKSILID